MSVTIYHNPRCSKSRQTLALLEEKAIKPEIIEYLKETPSVETIKSILDKLGYSARELMRKKEAEYKDNALDDETLDEEALIQALHDYPMLIERPIIISGEKAAIGRPPESVLEIL